ncbi:unnamed protein product [Laminaria digitata]
MDGLSSIRPEIEAFISRENRSHADKWLQQVNWAENERTLTLYIQKPPSPVGDATDTTRVPILATLNRPRLLRLYFPASLGEKPFCFCEDDALAPAAEAANERLRPLSCNSVLAVVTTVLQCVKREAPSIQAHLLDERSSADRALAAAEAVVFAIKEDPLGADLSLALLGMAVSSYRRDTVSSPFPKQLESEGCKRAYHTLISSLEDLPEMKDILRWVNPAHKLQMLPPAAVLTLHFVLVFLPTKLRISGQHASTPPSSSASSSINTKNKPTGAAAAASPSRDNAYCDGCGDGGGDAAGLAGAKVSGRGVSGAGGGGGGRLVSTHLGDVPSHVFDVVLPSDPAFDAEARLGGYAVAYHGSSPENFHSILNTGLRVMSGSRLMKNGAAFGNGM